MLCIAQAARPNKRRSSIVRHFLEDLARKENEARLANKRRKKTVFDQTLILALPYEIVVHILSFLEISEVLQCCVNTKLYSIINDTNCLWKALFEAQYLFFVSARRVKSVGHTEWKKECQYRRRVDDNWKNGVFHETLFSGHGDWVRCLQFEGDKLFSGSADKSIKVWDVATQECTATLSGHPRCINCLSYDNGFLASACSTVKIWNVNFDESDGAATRCVSTLRGHEDCIWCIQLRGPLSVSGSSDRTLRMWDIEVGQCVQILTGHSDCVCCLRILADDCTVLSGSSDSTVRRYDLRTKQSVSVLETHSDRVWCLQHEGNTLVTGSSDKTVKVWDFRTQTCIKALEGHTNSVWALQMEGDKLVSGSADSTVRVWDLKKDTLEACVSVINPNVGCVECLQFEDQRLVCGSSDSIIKMYDFS